MDSSINSEFDYDIAISFANEDRDKAEQIATALRLRGIRVFYDKFEQVNLWGKDLYEYLTEVYSSRARFCIPLISSNYAQKDWTRLERKSAQVRALKMRGEYILPVRLDDTPIPGIPDTILYVDLEKTSISQLVDMIDKKLSSVQNLKVSEQAGQHPEAAKPHIPLPKLRKQFSQREKNLFLRSAFANIQEYFQQALSTLKDSYSEVEVDFDEIHKWKFVCRIYVDGNLRSQCKIWIDNFGRSESIHYLADTRMDINKDNSWHFTFNVEDNGYDLYLSYIGFLPSYSEKNKNPDIHAVAEQLWKEFSQPLGT